MDKREYPRGPLQVILLAGLRASGKSLCGRALKHLLLDLGHCDYLDLDEVEEKTPRKFELFYKRCLQTMSAKGGIWILDKLGPYGDEARMRLLKEIRTTAEVSILLQFVHSVELEELRMCYFRSCRRGNNHRDVASSVEDVFNNINFEQAQRRGLTDSEVACLTYIKDVQMKATPFDMVFEAINHLHSVSFINKKTE